uniref:Uncharacterized protein n=1 Tax=Spironucleus salmonicida TaxID=348837 RepID=V6LYI1_9EUKA|eukprot:EST48776.1 Hypothetical protein SS50377_11012 [Spironucleus salmonicida]
MPNQPSKSKYKFLAKKGAGAFADVIEAPEHHEPGEGRHQAHEAAVRVRGADNQAEGAESPQKPAEQAQHSPAAGNPLRPRLGKAGPRVRAPGHEPLRDHQGPSAAATGQPGEVLLLPGSLLPGDAAREPLLPPGHKAGELPDEEVRECVRPQAGRLRVRHGEDQRPSADGVHFHALVSCPGDPANRRGLLV